MCLRPITIKNPTYSRKAYASERGSLVELPAVFSSSKEYIEVPCGKCADCRNSYYNSLLQRSLIEARTSYMYFVTLTYDNSHLPVITLPTGDDVYYSDYSHIQLLFKRLRDSNVLDREFRYLCVTEYGDTFSRPHFHLLLFVGKKLDDTPLTPYNIERILFDNIKRFYAVNVGTRKNPIYEPLFTYKLRYTSQGVKTNYFVKYVSPKVDTDAFFDSSDNSDTYIKTIRYLIGYINKGSAFDSVIEHSLSHITDEVILQKLRYLLRSRVRYSKGFGCGFTEDGNKFYMPRISVRASSKTIYYSDLVKTLPKYFHDFTEMYADVYEDLKKHISADRYRCYATLDDYISNMSSYEYFLHCLVMFYFPTYFSKIMKSYYKDSVLSSPKISYFFNKKPYKYAHLTVYTSDNIFDSPTFRYLRQGVEEGLTLGVPFLCFKTSTSFTSLCKFYRERVCTIDDIQRLYNSLGVRNYDEWSSLFLKQLDLRKAHLSSANRHIHENNDKIIWKSQKKYLHLSQRIAGASFYRYLLSNCK